MPNITLITSITAAAIASFGTFYYIGSREATIARFPEVDRKVAKKIHAEMIRESLNGKYKHLESTDAVFDNIFLKKVEKYNCK